MHRVAKDMAAPLPGLSVDVLFPIIACMTSDGYRDHVVDHGCVIDVLFQIITWPENNFFPPPTPRLYPSHITWYT
jgi:hypothetical protein